MWIQFSQNRGMQVDDPESYGENVEIVDAHAQLVDHQLKRVINRKVKMLTCRKLKINR